jgi:hypothetical protein
MKKTTLLAAGLAATLAGGAALPLSASVARAVSFNRKVHDADAIVLGKVVRTRADYDPSKRWILTYATFQVERSIKGQAAGEVTVAVPGGSVNGIRQETIGVPHYEQGDERVIFVKNTQLGPSVLYFDQGNYNVVRDGHDVMVAPAPSDVLLVDQQGGKAVEPDAQPLTLSEFEGRVKEALRTPSAATPGEFGFLPGGEKKAPQPVTTMARVTTFAQENKLLVAALAAGIALAAWQLTRKSS